MATNGWIPLYIKPEGLPVSVLGGGRIGERRALMFARAGARVRVYSLEFTRGLEEAASKGLLMLVRGDLRDPAVLREAVEYGLIVVIATGDPGINEAAARLALERGRLVNSAAKASLGNAVVPHARETSYGLRIAVTSLGATGVAARHAVEDCARILEDTYYRTLYRVMSRLKRWLLENVPDYRARFELYFVADRVPEVHELARQGREDEAYKAALEAVLRALGREG